MQIAFSTHAVTDYPEPGWGAIRSETVRAQVFDWATSVGFQGVEIADSWTDIYDCPKGYLEDIRAQLDQRRLATASINCLRKSLCHRELGSQNEQRLHQAIDVGDILGCGLLNVSLSEGPGPGLSAVRGRTFSPGSSLEATEHDFAVTAERLRGLARHAAERGQLLAIELHHCSLADTSRTLLKIIDMTGEPNVTANPDLVNGLWSVAQPRESWREALANLVDRMHLWHVKNVQRVYLPEYQVAEFVEAPLALGEVDYRWALRFAADRGFSGWISIEGAGPLDPFEKLGSAKRYLDGCLAAWQAGRLA
jgi:sugar phosphate isomerase/epimerase